MDYFIKSITDPADQAIRNDFTGHDYCPFVLFALHGFCDPLGQAEALFMIDFMLAVSPPDSRLLACRQTRDRHNEYANAVSSFCTRLPIDFGALTLEPEAFFEVVDPSNSAEFAESLREYWRTYFGHWFFCDSQSADGDLVAIEIVGRSWRKLSRARADLLKDGTINGITFDDQLLDLYIKGDITKVEAAAAEVAARHGVALTRSDG